VKNRHISDKRQGVFGWNTFEKLVVEVQHAFPCEFLVVRKLIERIGCQDRQIGLGGESENVPRLLDGVDVHDGGNNSRRGSETVSSADIEDLLDLI
jgi:hypothetical protein